MPKVYIHTGTNLGDRAANLARAAALLEASGVVIAQSSRVYETAAWGLPDQADFLNQALEAYTERPPLGLLELLLGIEQKMGRVRVQKWGSRLIDLDLLYYGRLVMETERLTLPHPFLHQRNFVLAPMMDIAPDWEDPKRGVPIRALFAQCPDRLPAEPWAGA